MLPQRLTQRPSKYRLEVFQTGRCGWGVRTLVSVAGGTLAAVAGALQPRAPPCCVLPLSAQLRLAMLAAITACVHVYDPIPLLDALPRRTHSHIRHLHNPMPSLVHALPQDTIPQYAFVVMYMGEVYQREEHEHLVSLVGCRQ